VAESQLQEEPAAAAAAATGRHRTTEC